MHVESHAGSMKNAGLLRRYAIDFLDREMAQAGQKPLDRAQWVNVRRWSEAMFGDEGARLDNVLDRYGLPHDGRGAGEGHGALIDAMLLARAYPFLRRDYEAFRSRDAAGPSAPSPLPPT